MAKIDSKKKEIKYLKSKSRFYIAGWFDAKRKDRPQFYTDSKDTSYYVDYMHGYADSLCNGESEEESMQCSGWISNKESKSEESCGMSRK